jgi:hypothetical protein
MSRSHGTSIKGLVGALLAALAGIAAFNAIDGVFGQIEAIGTLVASIALTAFVVRRSPPADEEPDA